MGSTNVRGKTSRPAATNQSQNSRTKRRAIRRIAGDVASERNARRLRPSADEPGTASSSPHLGSFRSRAGLDLGSGRLRPLRCRARSGSTDRERPKEEDGSDEGERDGESEEIGPEGELRGRLDV